jgi:hypothetical protein
VSQDVLADLARVDVDSVALVDRPLDLDEGPPGAAEIVREEPGRIVVEASAPARRLLILNESLHPGWRIDVDGVGCDMVRVYGDFMGCVVAGGHHLVSFRFAPASFERGILATRISVGIALMWLIAAAWQGVRHR